MHLIQVSKIVGEDQIHKAFDLPQSVNVGKV